MSVGIAFSGGGVPAAIGAACAWNTFVETYPLILNSSCGANVTVSTVSGGSIGYGLWVNANDKIQFTPYQYNLTLEDLYDEQNRSRVDNEQSNRALNFLFSNSRMANLTSCDGFGAKHTVGDIANYLFSPIFAKQFVFAKEDRNPLHWWESIIHRVFGNLCVNDIKSGDVSWLISFAHFNQSVTFDRSSDWGYLLPSSADSLRHVIADMNSGEFQINLEEGPIESKDNQKMKMIHALSYSSAFWASGLMSNYMMNMFFNKMLITRSTSDLIESSLKEKSDVIMMDGGVIDTTGIVGLLKRKKDHIVAFYNNNVPLTSISSPIAYLFGVNGITDAMNSLKGPLLSQVFPSSLYPAVIQNLTDPRVGFAYLENLDIIHNQMGVEPYRLSSLIIFSNGKMNKFRFTDKRIQSSLSRRWPDNFFYGLPSLDANVLCSFSAFKVRMLQKMRNLFRENCEGIAR